MTSPFYAACIEGAKPVATASGYELLIMAPPSEDDYATQDRHDGGHDHPLCKGIAVCGINLDALIPGIKKANEGRDFQVVMFNTITPLEGVEVYAYSGYNQYNGGGKIADWVNEKTGGKAKVAIIEGLPSGYTTQRMGGFVDPLRRAILTSRWWPPSRVTGCVKRA